ncbi:hypothetical protein ASE40_11260 [Flavobacterium sp. Root935]|nr:hypothetical protein ASE40_11260 [Flavobacterium sp. Root935]
MNKLVLYNFTCARYKSVTHQLHKDILLKKKKRKQKQAQDKWPEKKYIAINPEGLPKRCSPFIS